MSNSDLQKFLLNRWGIVREDLQRLTSEMGQVPSSYSLDDSIEPGTYRIVHVKTDKVLRPDDDQNQKLVIWGRQHQGSRVAGRMKDHWYVQRSGEGYRFKHCQSGAYIAITPGSPVDIRGTQYPATWAIYSKKDSDIECILATDATQSRVMSLLSGSNSHGSDGDTVRLSRLYQDDDEVWRLERVGDSSGVSESTLELKRIMNKLDKRESELNQFKNELSKKGLECDSRSTQLAETISELNRVKHELSEMKLERDGLSTQLAEANAEKSEAKLGLIRAQEELGWKVAKLSEKEEELAEKESELVKKDEELTGVKNKLEAKEEEFIGKEDQLVHMNDQLNSKEEELARAQKVIGAQDAEMGKLIQQLAAKDREMLRRSEKSSVEDCIKLKKVHEPLNREEALRRIQVEHAVNPRLHEQSSEMASQSPGRPRAGTSSHSTGVDVKLADLGWDFDDSE